MIWLSEDEYMQEYGEWDYEARCVNDSVCWMNFSKDEDGIMKVIPWGNGYEGKDGSPHLDSFLVRADNPDENFICPFRQKDGTKWAHVVTSKMESNLNIWVIYIFGADDASYTHHSTSKAEMNIEIDIIKDKGITAIKELNFFFTN